jgi:hypothetical protein
MKRFLPAGLIVLVVLGLLVYWQTRPVDTIERGLPSYQGRGEIPALHQVMATDGALRDAVSAYCDIPAPQFFIDKASTDKAVIDILMDWANIDTKSPPPYEVTSGLNPYVDMFLRKAYGLSPNTIIRGNPLLGKDPWERIFRDFKYTIFAQCEGRTIFNGELVYDVERNRIAVPAKLSPAFIQTFGQALSTAPDKGAAVNGLLAYIDHVVGIKNLSPQDTQTLQKWVQ